MPLQEQFLTYHFTFLKLNYYESYRKSDILGLRGKDPKSYDII